MFKSSIEWLLLKPAQQRLFMQFLIEKRNHKKQFVCGDASLQCISHASRIILPRVVTFYQEIFYKCCFSNTSRRLLLKLPRKKTVILIQSQVAERQHISQIFFFFLKLFTCVITVFSPYFISPLQSTFLQGSSENAF